MEAELTDTMRPGRAALGAATIAEAFRITADERDGEVAIRTKQDAFSITWGELRERVDALAGGLAKLGVKRGDSVALLMTNRPEFHLCDLAAMMLGATPFSIYNTYTAEQIRYVVADADAKVLICEQQYLPQVRDARKELPQLGVRDRGRRRGSLGTLALSEVEGSDPDFDVDAAVSAGQVDGCPDADLHLRHHRSAQGRAAGSPQPARDSGRHRGSDRVPARWPRGLVAACRSRGRA